MGLKQWQEVLITGENEGQRKRTPDRDQGAGVEDVTLIALKMEKRS